MPSKKPVDPEHNRIGFFYISYRYVVDSPITVASIMCKMGFCPLRVEVHAERQEFYYAGYSPFFERKEHGAVVPEYCITIHSDENGMVELVEVELRKPPTALDIPALDDCKDIRAGNDD